MIDGILNVVFVCKSNLETGFIDHDSDVCKEIPEFTHFCCEEEEEY